MSVTFKKHTHKHKYTHIYIHTYIEDNLHWLFLSRNTIHKWQDTVCGLQQPSTPLAAENGPLLRLTQWNATEKSCRTFVWTPQAAAVKVKEWLQRLPPLTPLRQQSWAANTSLTGGFILPAECSSVCFLAVRRGSELLCQMNGGVNRLGFRLDEKQLTRTWDPLPPLTTFYKELMEKQLWPPFSLLQHTLSPPLCSLNWTEVDEKWLTLPAAWPRPPASWPRRWAFGASRENSYPSLTRSSSLLMVF